MSDPRPRRRQSWMRAQSDTGFRPIKQVGLAVSIGFPLMVIGVIMLVIMILSAGPTALWIAAAAVLAVGLVAAISGRII